MGLLRWMAQVKQVLRNPHFWVILIYLTGCGIMHYAEQLGLITSEFPKAFLGLSRHTFFRILFLVPIIYSGFVFGLAGGLVVSLIALLLMIPRIILILDNGADALAETVGIILVGVLVTLLFKAQKQSMIAKEQRKLALEMSDMIQHKLRSQVRLTMEQQERLTTLGTILNLLAEPLQPMYTYRIAIDRIIDLLKVDAVLIFLIDQPTDNLVLKAYEGISPQLARKLGKMKLMEIIKTQASNNEDKAAMLENSLNIKLQKALEQEDLQSQLGVSMKIRGQVAGFLYVAKRLQREFLHDDSYLLAVVGNELGIALENARLYQEQLLTAQQLEVSEKKYRELFELAQDAIWVHDMKGNISSANEATARLTGYEIEHLHQMNVKSFLSDESRRIARDIRSKLLNSEPVAQPYEQRITTKGGDVATLMLTTNVVKIDGKPTGFQNIARDVTKEKRLEENLNFYLQHITRAQEEERKRISRELHDSTAQTLIAMLHQLGDFLQSKASLKMGDTRVLWGIHEELRTVLQEVRQFARDLRPSILDDLGLIPSLEWLCSEMRKESGIDSELKVLGSERRFPAEVELMLFRIIQEALRNVTKHSCASRAWVTVDFNKHTTKVTVEDNGNGFVIPENITDLSRLGKLGLTGMQERARLLGVNLKVESERDKGTTVSLEAPF